MPQRPGSPTPPLGVPRAGLDPIRDPRSALAVIGLATARPRRHETALMVLDQRWHGEHLVVVDGTDADGGPPHEPLLEVIELGGQIASATLGPDALGLVIASLRPDRGPTPDDARTWHAMAGRADDLGLVLIEWFVIGAGGIHCPRDLAGDPARWPR